MSATDEAQTEARLRCVDVPIHDRGGGTVTAEEEAGIELLLSDPEIVAWLEPAEIDEGDDQPAD
jgi:hypothetical protein